MSHERKQARLKTLLKGYFKVTPVGKTSTGKYTYELTELKPSGFPKYKYKGKWKVVGYKNDYYTFQEVV